MLARPDNASSEHDGNVHGSISLKTRMRQVYTTTKNGCSTVYRGTTRIRSRSCAQTTMPLKVHARRANAELAVQHRQFYAESVRKTYTNAIAIFAAQQIRYCF